MLRSQKADVINVKTSSDAEDKRKWDKNQFFFKTAASVLFLLADGTEEEKIVLEVLLGRENCPWISRSMTGWMIRGGRRARLDKESGTRPKLRC